MVIKQLLHKGFPRQGSFRDEEVTSADESALFDCSGTERLIC